MNPLPFMDNPSGLQSPIDHVSCFDLSVDQFPSSLFSVGLFFIFVLVTHNPNH